MINMTNDKQTPFCGVTTGRHPEEGYCAFHLADLLGIPKLRVDYLRATGALEFFPAADPLTCGRQRRGDCLVPAGQVHTMDVAS